MFNNSNKTILFTLSIITSMFVGCGEGEGGGVIDDLTQETTHTKERTIKDINIPSFQNSTGITINEILAANTHTNLDPDFYAFSDWIELYNSTDKSVDISGFYLSDDKSNPTKYQIPNHTTIPANQHLLIWADNKNIKNKAIHANFKLSQKGEDITLADSSGRVIDMVMFAKQKIDISCAKSGNKPVYLIPSPKHTNTQDYKDITQSQKPIISDKSGFYSDHKSISFEPKKGQTIYYTTDGSTPTKKSKRYTSPISINKTTVFKAISIEENKLPSDITTTTYIINHETTLPVVSLSIDEKYLYDDMIGIYTDGKNGIAGKYCYKHANDKPKDYKNFNQDWERPVHIEYFDENRQKAFEIGSNISISGQCSKYNRKKSFSFSLDSKYGDKSLKYPLYEDKPAVDKVEDFKLRTGQGGYQIGDLLGAAFVEDGKFDIDYQAYKSVQMFLNGKYWGIYNFREKKGKNYLKSNYPDIDKKNIDIIAHTMYGDTVKLGDKVAFDKLFNYIKTHDLSKSSNYREVFEMVDEDNFIDYMVFMIYSGNQDWIYNNTRAWKEKKDGAKWRWMLDDLDNGFMATNFDSFRHATKSSTLISYLFKGVLKNQTFKQKFKERFYHHLNGVFSKDNMLAIIDKHINAKREYMNLEINRWKIDRGLLDSHAKTLRDFATNRNKYIKNGLNKL